MKTRTISIIAAASIAAAFALPSAASSAPSPGAVKPAEIGAQTSGVTNVGYYGYRTVRRCTPIYRTRVRTVYGYGRVYRRTERYLAGHRCRNYTVRVAPRVYYARPVYRYRTVRRCTPVYRTRVRTVYGYGRVYRRTERYLAGRRCRTYRVRSY